MQSANLISASLRQRLGEFFALCKPRVNTLIVFTAMIGMWLADPVMSQVGRFFAATVGIALVAGAAAAINCLVERTSDALMTRTRMRATARGAISAPETLTLATIIGSAGLWLLHVWVNDLTMWLTLATFLGYAVIYTAILKPMGPMNIVIGGAAGAMPPALGWAAMTGTLGIEAFTLFLLIFLWTPPHFWSLACYRREDFARAALPMLPVTHGVPATCRQILVYTGLLSLATLLPVGIGMSGGLYLIAALALDAGFLAYALRLIIQYDDALARKAFRYSIVYLTLLFTALIVDRLIRY